MEGIIGLTGKIDNLIATNQSFDAGFLRLDQSVQQIVHDQRVMRTDVLKAHVLTTNSQATGHMAQAAVALNQANVLNQTALLVSSMMDQPAQQQIIPPFELQTTIGATPSTMHTGTISEGVQMVHQQLPPIPQTLLQSFTTQTQAEPTDTMPTPATVTAPIPTPSLPVASGLNEGDPNIYHFFVLTKGNEILQCFQEYETGLYGKPSVLSIEKEHGGKWRIWKKGEKRINKKSKTFFTRLAIYKAVKKMARDKNCTVVESSEKLQEEFNQFVKQNMRRGIDYFSEILKQRD
ncbi:UNVERIFIED_CONTAM: hypothetical protein HDU68_002965 [Siphonaria sp. JEL0065]|nr:hypothetical protein HDU68_002965 [Siphonaria sp. JEL0065]